MKLPKQKRIHGGYSYVLENFAMWQTEDKKDVLTRVTVEVDVINLKQWDSDEPNVWQIYTYGSGYENPQGWWEGDCLGRFNTLREAKAELLKYIS